jgi:hypothetical protein
MCNCYLHKSFKLGSHISFKHIIWDTNWLQNLKHTGTNQNPLVPYSVIERVLGHGTICQDDF